MDIDKIVFKNLLNKFPNILTGYIPVSFTNAELKVIFQALQVLRVSIVADEIKSRTTEIKGGFHYKVNERNKK